MKKLTLYTYVEGLLILSIFIFCNQQSSAASIRYDVGNLQFTIDTEARTAELDGFVNSPAIVNNLIIPDCIDFDSSRFPDYWELDGSQIPIVSIKEEAFYGQTNLTGDLTIGNNIKYIGDNAFYGCNSLIGISFPKSIREIGVDAFKPSNDSELLRSRIDITDLTAWLDIDFKNWDSNPLRDAHNIYLNGKLITKIDRLDFPHNATKVKDFIMVGAFCLEEVYLPDPFTEIGECAFNNCKFLSKLETPLYLEKIGSRALAGTALTDFKFPPFLSTLEYGALGQTKIKEIIIPSSVKSIGEAVFMSSSELETVRIGDGIECIESNCFADCPKLRVLYMGENIKEVHMFAFNRDFGLEELHVSNLTNWCNIQFEHFQSNPLYYAGSLYLNGTKLTELDIPEGIKQINNYCFYNANLIKKLNLPLSIENIGYETFAECNSLIEVNSQKLSPPPHIDDSTFSQSTYEKATLYTSSKSLTEYRNAEGWKNFMSIKSPSVSINVSQLNLKIGEEYQLRVIFDPEDLLVGNIEWQSSNADVIKVNEAGLIKAINIGTANVTIKTDTGLSASCAVTVTPIEADEIILSETDIFILVGQSLTLSATVNPQNVTFKDIDWKSSNPNVVSVNQDGTLKALAAGIADITATCGEAMAKCTVTVKSGSDIQVTPGDGTGSGEGEDNGNGWIDGKNIYVHVNRTVSMILSLPQDISKLPTLIWRLAEDGDQYVTLTPSDDTLSASFTGKKVGETTYSLTIEGEVVWTGNITVIAEVTMNSLALEPAEISLAQNALPVQLKTIVSPDNATQKEFSWKSDEPEVATVSESGLVLPVSQGETIVIATALDGSGLTATCHVSITAPIDDNFTLEFDDALMGGLEGVTIYIGDTFTLTPSAHEGHELPKDIIWNSSDKEKVTVDSEGKVTGIALGEAIISATASVNGKEAKASCKVTVIPIPAQSIDLGLENMTLLLGQSYQLKANVYPENTTNQEITWTSSAPDIVSVDAGGTVTAIMEGEASITATCGTASATCKVTVSPITPSSIELNVIDMVLYIGQSETLQAIVRPPNTTYPTVTWQSDDPSVATVSSNGQVTGIKEGTALITATCGNVSASCQVTVNPILASNIEITSGNVTLTIGNSTTLTAKVSPDNTTHPEVDWSSSDNNIVTISVEGTVTAVNIGTAIITAKCGNVFATCTVTVIPVPSEGIVISPSEVAMLLGDTFTLSATVFPENTTDKNVTWGSDNPAVASVSSSGVVTALSLGTARITARNGNSSTSCLVTVNPIVATGISLDVKDETIFVASSTQLIATISPFNVTDKTISWTSSKPEIATVSDNGEVYGVSVGTTTVTATIGSVSASAQINVVHRIPDMDPSVITSERDIVTISGRPVNMAVFAEGGEPSGWSYLWTKNGKTVSKSSELNITAKNETNTVIAETYRVKVENEIDKVVILSEIFDFVVQIYPEVENLPEGNHNGISISTGTESANKTREGNLITLSASTPNGGYPKGWEYIWSHSQQEIGEGESIQTIATMSPGNSMTVEEATYNLDMTNYGPEGDMWAQYNLQSNPIEIYRRPLTPLQMLRKGNGTSHTFVTMMSLPDPDLTQLDYEFIYGWTDADGKNHVIEQTNERYCRTDAEIYNNPTNKFWVYSIWVYKDGCMVSSGLRYLDGSADEDFDASVFDGSFVRMDKKSQIRTAIYTIDGQYIGNDVTRLAPGIYIYTSTNHGMMKTEKIIIR